MPGFNIGGGSSSRQKSNTAEPRRKHRWRVTALGDILAPGELVYLMKAARPQFKYEAPEMHHDQEVAYFAGKQTWEPITFTFYDIEQPIDVSQKLYFWVNTVTTSFLNPAAETAVDIPANYKKDASLELTDGQGRASETWDLFGCWPMDTNWNDLDYTNTEIQLVDVVVRYDKGTPSKQSTGAGT
jgi:hypothetical protein